MDVRICSAVLVQMKGWGVSFQSLVQSRLSFSSARALLGHHNDDHLTDTGREPVVHQQAIKLGPQSDTTSQTLREP